MRSRSRILAPLLAVPVLLSLLVAAISPVLPISAAPGAPAGSSFHRLYFLYDKTTGQYTDDALARMSSSAGDEAEVEALLPRQSEEVNPARITFRSGVTIHPAPGMAAGVREGLAAPGEGAFAKFWLIQFRYPFPTESRTRLEEAGVRFYDYVDVCGFFAKVPPGGLSLLEEMLDEGLVRYVGGIPREAKVNPALVAEATRQPAVEKAIVVLTFDEPTAAQLEELGRWVTIEGRSTGPIHFVEGRASGASIVALANLDNVRWVEERGEAELGNLEGGMGIGADIVRAAGFDGTGVQVMVVDSGIARQGDVYHPDLLGDRILDQRDYQSNIPEDDDATDDYDLNNGHGTHVAGTIGGSYNPGDSNSVRSYQGVAPDVDFLIYRLFGFDNPFDPEWFEDALERGTSEGRTAHVSNNSWGYGANGDYAVVSEFADAAVLGLYNGRPVNLVAAAMNENKLVRSPGTGKNVIAVGAVKDGGPPFDMPVYNAFCGEVDYNWPPGEALCYSNYGPIDTDIDGAKRVKPDLVAPGSLITSAAPWYEPFTSDYYFTTHGTSQATPHVTGAIAQVLDVYSEVEGGALFDWPEMVKAMLLATAVDIGGADKAHYGHGLLDAYHAIYAQTGVDEPMDVWAGSVSETHETQDFSFYVPAGYAEVRAVLTWADPPGETEAINNLDVVSVKDAGGGLRGWSVSSDDTVEYVRILTEHTPGTWTIQVKATSLAQTPQPFALAAHVILDGADLSIRAEPATVPGMGLPLVPGGGLYLHQYVSNSGYTAGGSYAKLHVPVGFTVTGATVYTQDGREHWYGASDLYHDADSAPRDWFIAVGDALAGFERHVRWAIEIDEETVCGAYSFDSTAYWLEAGEQQASGTVTTKVPVACHFTYLPVVSRGY